MGFNQILTLVGLIISIVAVFFAELAAYSGLLLVIFGLTSGFVSPIADLTGRMAYTVAAVAIPVVANSLDVIPGIGMHLNAIIDNIAIMIAGMVIPDKISDWPLSPISNTSSASSSSLLTQSIATAPAACTRS